MDVATCDKHDGVGGESIMSCWSRFSGHAASTLHMLLLALFLPTPHILLPSRDERNEARCNCAMWVMSGRPYNRHNYITMFHLVGQPPIEDSQPCPTDSCAAYWMHAAEWLLHIGPYRHTDATDTPMFSLSLMLPIFDVWCANRPNSNIKLTLGWLQFCIYCRSHSHRRHSRSRSVVVVVLCFFGDSGC